MMLMKKKVIIGIVILILLILLAVILIVNQNNSLDNRENNANSDNESEGTVQNSSRVEDDFQIDLVYNIDGRDIHYSVYIPENINELDSVNLFITLPGWEGLYFQGVGVNLEYEDFAFTARDINPNMIILAPQLDDWQEQSALDTVALTKYYQENYNIDKIYIEGYSGGGETLSLVLDNNADLYDGALMVSSQWDGGYEDVEIQLRRYYTEKDETNDINHNELECDFVATRTALLLNEDNFELSLDYLKYVHKYLFQDVYEFAGEFRKIDFSKHEKILNNDSVAYGDCTTLRESLEYDISLEKEKNYNKMNMVEVINNITKFTSSIWQVHPFREGNTRTIALFIQKYLISLGYNVDNSLFKDKSVYFRNALVRSNYFNNYLDIKEDNSYLIKFYENLLLGKNNNLHSCDLIVKKLFDKEN